MATQGAYLVNNTVTDCNALLSQLEQARRLVTRITERMKSIGEPWPGGGYTWPDGYTYDDFHALYQALNGLPDSIVDNSVRNAIHKLVSFIQ